MDINGVFPSNFLKASDLLGKPRIVVMKDCVMDQVAQNEPAKPVLHFDGIPRGLILNRTNAAVISSAYGTETTAWVGKKLELFTMPVSFQGRVVDAIRVRPVLDNQPAPQTQEQVTSVEAPVENINWA